MVPAEPATSDEAEFSLRQLLGTLQLSGMSSLAELESVLTEARAKAPMMLSEFAKAVQNRGRPFEAYGIDLVTVVVSLSKADEIGGGMPWSFFHPHIIEALRERMRQGEPQHETAA